MGRILMRKFRSSRDRRDHQMFLWTTDRLIQELAAERRRTPLWMWA